MFTEGLMFMLSYDHVIGAPHPFIVNNPLDYIGFTKEG